MRRQPPKAQSLLGAYIELTKPNITFLILVSTALGFYLGAGNLDKLREFLLTLIGSGLVSSGAGALNHYAEKETDQLMNRTKSRPIPTGMVDEEMALVFGISLILSGTLILYSFINQFTGILGLITALLYLFIYTPLKKLTWLNMIYCLKTTP